MKYGRASEILNSNEKIEVFYNNSPVWIKGLNFDRATADIIMYPSENNQQYEVPINDLKEYHKLH